jgi:hypothetical protein
MSAIPGFSAEATAYRTSRRYRGAANAGFSAGITPAIPPCRNCDSICDLCIDTGRACGACRLCSIGACDPCPPGGCEPPDGWFPRPPF